jgi:hypothetical protein
LPVEIAAHIWDIYLYEGERYLLCVTLGILKMYAAKLSMMKVEKISPFLLHLPNDINSEQLFYNISLIKITKSNYEKIRLKKCIKTYGSHDSYQKSLQKIHSNSRFMKQKDQINSSPKLSSSSSSSSQQQQHYHNDNNDDSSTRPSDDRRSSSRSRSSSYFSRLKDIYNRQSLSWLPRSSTSSKK